MYLIAIVEQRYLENITRLLPLHCYSCFALGNELVIFPCIMFYYGNKYIIILYYMKIFFQKVSVGVLTHLIGQNNRTVCKRHCLSWRCIQCHEAHSASRSGPAGPATATKHKPLKPVSNHDLIVQAEQERRYCTCKLGHQVSCEARGSVTVNVLCHTCSV